MTSRQWRNLSAGVAAIVLIGMLGTAVLTSDTRRPLSSAAEDQTPVELQTSPTKLEIQIIEFNGLPSDLKAYEVIAEMTNPSGQDLPPPSCSFIANERQAAAIDWDNRAPIRAGETQRRRGTMRFGRQVKDVSVDEFKCNDAELDPF